MLAFSLQQTNRYYSQKTNHQKGNHQDSTDVTHTQQKGRESHCNSHKNLMRRRKDRKKRKELGKSIHQTRTRNGPHRQHFQRKTERKKEKHQTQVIIQKTKTKLAQC